MLRGVPLRHNQHTQVFKHFHQARQAILTRSRRSRHRSGQLLRTVTIPHRGRHAFQRGTESARTGRFGRSRWTVRRLKLGSDRQWRRSWGRTVSVSFVSGRSGRALGEHLPRGGCSQVELRGLKRLAKAILGGLRFVKPEEIRVKDPITISKRKAASKQEKRVLEHPMIDRNHRMVLLRVYKPPSNSNSPLGELSQARYVRACKAQRSMEL